MTQNSLIHLPQDQGPIEYEVDLFDQCIGQLFRVNIELAIIKDGYKAYKYDGVILRIEQIYDNFMDSEIFHNIEQIQYLKWGGEYGESKKKFGKWIASWNGETLFQVGGQYENGLKQGIWKEPSKNYWSQVQVYNIGEYINNQKQGKWICIYNFQKFGGGVYNEKGQRDGKWIVPSEGFYTQSQVMYKGVQKNGKKVGRWDTLYRKSDEEKFEEIGGGYYAEMKLGSIKSGNWIVLIDDFQQYEQVIYNGEYHNGKNLIDGIFYRDVLNGGGLYQNVKYDSIKIGQWIEFDPSSEDKSDITHKGQYCNGKKIGRWDILYQHKDGEKIEQIGGGSYDHDKEGNLIKIGIWIELSEQFAHYKQISYIGEYQHGEKIGRWDILFRLTDKEIFQQIGGGFYEEYKEGISQKTGSWIELSRFDYLLQVLYSGIYNRGQKIGGWDILYRQKVGQGFELIGGGSYEENNEKSQVKVGRWVELSKDIDSIQQATYNGEYKNDQKVGIG